MNTVTVEKMILIRARVAAGAALLDAVAKVNKHAPAHWRELVNMSVFAITCPSNGIIGQVFGDWSAVRNVLDIHARDSEVAFGFEVSSEEYQDDYDGRYSNAYREAWAEQISQ